MTKSRLLTHVGVSLVGASTLITSALAAPEGVVLAKKQSPYFPAVASQLEMGGLSFSYSDQGSKNALYAGVVKMAVAYLEAHTEFKGVDAKKLIELFTLKSVVASGSSASQYDGFVHYRSYNYMPEEKSSYALAYGEAKPSVALQLAPAGADLVMEMHFNGSYDPDAEEKMYAALGPLGTKLKELQASQPSNPLMASYQKNYSKINSRISFIADLSPEGFKGIQGLPFGGQLLVSVTNAEPVWEIFKPLLAEQGLNAIDNGGVEEIVFPAEMIGWKPYLQYNNKTKQLFVSTTREYLDLCQKCFKGEAPNLSQDKEWLKVKEGLPSEFSNMVYVSPNFTSMALNLIDAFGVPQIEEEQYVRPAVKMLMEKLKASEVTKTATVYTVSFQEKGTLHVANSPVHFPEFKNATTTTGVALVGGSTLFVGAKYYRENANKAACVINMSSFSKATQAVQNINGYDQGDPLTWDLIVGEDGPLQQKPICPSGGTYTLSKVFPKQGDTVITCDCEGHVLHQN
ncbi:hypothetical protein [Rubritalea sp.]|uniref:hypothetical protein n=1 Tax=Rubritalea sp. TaxID=2109375 RepID=UPI003EF9CC48